MPFFASLPSNATTKGQHKKNDVRLFYSLKSVKWYSMKKIRGYDYASPSNFDSVPRYILYNLRLCTFHNSLLHCKIDFFRHKTRIWFRSGELANHHILIFFQPCLCADSYTNIINIIAR